MGCMSSMIMTSNLGQILLTGTCTNITGTCNCLPPVKSDCGSVTLLLWLYLSNILGALRQKPEFSMISMMIIFQNHENNEWNKLINNTIAELVISLHNVCWPWHVHFFGPFIFHFQEKLLGQFCILMSTSRGHCHYLNILCITFWLLKIDW